VRHGAPWIETVLYSFAERFSGDAAFPSGELITGKNGKLYGAALLGGANDVGAVYELSPPAVAGSPWTEKVIFSFDGTMEVPPLAACCLMRVARFTERRVVEVPARKAPYSNSLPQQRPVSLGPKPYCTVFRVSTEVVPQQE
jgi:hypothetical protein